MTPRTLVLAASLTVAGSAIAACGPPQTNGVQRYTCDEIHMPGNEPGWCVTWTRPNGMKVTGPASRRDSEAKNPGVVYP